MQCAARSGCSKPLPLPPSPGVPEWGRSKASSPLPISSVESVPSQEPAKAYGAIVDPARTNAVDAILEITHGIGVGSAVEALGSEETLAQAITVTRPGGTICNVGYHGKGDTIGIPRVGWGVGMAEKTIASALCPSGRLRLERLLRVLQSGLVDPSLMTTHRFPFSAIERAFIMMRDKSDGIIKPLIEFPQ